MKYRIRKERLEDYAFDINIAPMLDMLVTLIPTLLLSMVFIRVAIIDAPIPSTVATAPQEQADKKDKNVNVRVYLSKDEAKIEVNDNGAKESHRVALKDGKYDLNAIHSELVQVKVKNPSVFKIEINPTETVAYKDVVSVMDEARNLKETDPKVFIQDKQTGEKMPTELMFPDAVFGNIVEG